MTVGIKATLWAIGAATLALTSAFATAYDLRRAARRVSHRLPTAESWFDAPAATSPARRGAGRKTFLHYCAHCHGADASGDEGPDLRDLEVSDRYIVNTISHGVPHEMPSFARKFSPPDFAALLAYLRSLPADAAPADEPGR